MIRLAAPTDADAVCRIYNPYVLETIISFEEAPVAATEMAARIADLCRTHPWYVYEESGVVIGYAYASPWRARTAYRDAVESTVYVESMSGIGSSCSDGFPAHAIPASLPPHAARCAGNPIASSASS